MLLFKRHFQSHVAEVSEPLKDLSRFILLCVLLAGPVALVMYDLTTLHFEVTNEDRLRKVGMSKERRVDPQVTVGLLVTADGFPLEVALFEGYAEVGVMPRCVCCAL